MDTENKEHSKESLDNREFLTVKQCSDKYPAFSIGSMRYLIFNAKKNGLNSALIKIGKKLLINENKFLAWVDSHSNEQ